MEQQFCEKCHQSGIKVLLRQSEELLCRLTGGWPPSWDINEEHQELDLDREEAQVDHSFRFTFSTQSIIEDINNTALCISQFQAPTSPPPGRPPGFCTLLLPRGRDLYLMTFPGGRVFAYP